MLFARQQVLLLSICFFLLPLEKSLRRIVQNAKRVPHPDGERLQAVITHARSGFHDSWKVMS